MLIIEFNNVYDRQYARHFAACIAPAMFANRCADQHHGDFLSA
jgi:hypothetical protein